jgi:hypothetical protein
VVSQPARHIAGVGRTTAVEGSTPSQSAMSTKENGGPAFPTAGYSSEGYTGMALRDYFAAAAMRGRLAAYALSPEGHEWATARWAYKMADAMLAARESVSPKSPA